MRGTQARAARIASSRTHGDILRKTTDQPDPHDGCQRHCVPPGVYGQPGPHVSPVKGPTQKPPLRRSSETLSFVELTNTSLCLH